MLYPTEATETFERLFKEIAKPDADHAGIARRILALDPAFGLAYNILALKHLEAGEEEQAEAMFWKALEQWPGTYHFYTPLGALRIQRNQGDAIAADLHYLGVWKLSMMEEIPKEIAATFQPMVESFGDPGNPESYRMAATLLEMARNKEAPPVDGRVRPYFLLNELQHTAPSVVDYQTVKGIREHATECVPLLHAALRQWARGMDGVTDQAGCMIVALLGEIGGPEILPELLEIADDERLFLHIHWAIHRMAERDPEAALAALRAATPDAGVSLRCGLAEQMFLMNATPGLEDAIAALVDHFSRLSRHQDAPHLLLAVRAGLVKLGAEARARAILARCEAMLPKKERSWVRDILESEEGFMPMLDAEGIAGFDIDDVCLERVLMDEEDDEDDEDFEDEDDEDEFDDEEDDEEDEFDEDEEDEDEDEEDDEETSGAAKVPALMTNIAEYAMTHYRDADQQRAKKLYFGTSGKVQSDQDEIEDFMQWLIMDYRSPGSNQTILDRYRRDRESMLSARERLYIDSLRSAQFGIWEVQRVEPGRGVQVKNLYGGDEMFVRDVSSSGALVQWDCAITRVQRFEGDYLFSGNGTTIPRSLLPKFRHWISEESRKARQTEEEFVRANSHRLRRRVHEMANEQRENLKLANTEGHSLEFSQANYQVLDQTALLAKLRETRDLSEESGGEEPDALRFAWMEPGAADEQRTILGHLTILGGRLRLECNSRKRLTRLRRALEKPAKGSLKHLGDSFESAEAAMKRHRDAPSAEPRKSIPPEVERELIAQMKSQHYADWADEKLPALDGKTPRQAVTTKSGREAVLDLIRMFENGEARQARQGGAAFDFTPIRKELGLE